ncbi:MAG: Hpt domain-containing protein [Candidatus Obscuribacterales bacterium]
MASAFLEDTASAFTQIDQGVEAKDHESVRRAAHMLKGCSRVIKASICERASRELEVEAAAGNWESIPARISDLRQAYASTETFLHSYIEGRSG